MASASVSFALSQEENIILVCIFSTANQFEADLVKSALDERNIDNYLKNYRTNALGLAGWTTTFAGTNLLFGNIEVIVREEDAEEAFDIVKVLFGSLEENEELLSSSNDSETIKVENYKEDLNIYDNAKENEGFNNRKNKKLSAKNKFFIFLGIVLFLVIFFQIFINKPSSQVSNRRIWDSRHLEPDIGNRNVLITERDLVGVWELERTENLSTINSVNRLEFYYDGTGLIGNNSMTWQLREGNRIFRESDIGTSLWDIEIAENGTLLIYHYDGFNYSGIRPQKAMYRKVADIINQKYYYEMFLVDKPHYFMVSQPSTWDMNSIRNYRNELKNTRHYRFLYSTADAYENELFSLLTNSGYTPGETTDIISYINNVGNFFILGDYQENTNYVHVAYFEMVIRD